MNNRLCCPRTSNNNKAYSNPQSYGTGYRPFIPDPPECYTPLLSPGKSYTPQQSEHYCGACHSNPSNYGLSFRNEHDFYWGCKKGMSGCSHAKHPSAFQGIL